MRTSDLPEAFLSDMKALLGEDYESYLASLDKRPLSGLRVNLLKTDPEYVASRYPELKPVPWTENGFYISGESAYTRNPHYYAGLYYIQEPSAMTPAALLNTEPGDAVLDLCAAPGGKATEIGARLQGKGVLVANDLSSSRARALLKNLELFGIGNAYVTTEDSSRLLSFFPERFDRILIDAPCSGEGMFRKHPAVIRAYLEHGRDFYCPVQSQLLDDAALMLKPGGTLLYSTCTYNVHEDEEQIIGFLSRHPEFMLDPVAPREGFTMSPILPGTVRLFPHHAEAEGHFAARLIKKGEKTDLYGGDPFPAPGAAAAGRSGADRSRKKELSEVQAFFSGTGFQPDPSRILVQNEYVSMLPEKLPFVPGLRYLRTGLLLGQLKNDRFKPSQALAMYLKKEDWQDPVDLPSDDPRVIRYLKGETIEAEGGSPDGLKLFLTDGFPLGFVKQERGRLKNLYLQGWRWM